MHSSGSILRTFVENIRQYVDDPDLDAKYTNQYLIDYVMGPSMVDVIQRINMMATNPVLLRHTITMTTNTEYYTLPPSIKDVWRMTILDLNGHVIREAIPRGEFNPRGPMWGIEGNLLFIRPRPIATGANDSLDIWYVPNGEISPVLGTAGQLNAGPDPVEQTVLTLGGTTTLGRIDRRPNAYAGMYLRMISTVAAVAHEERLIQTHDQQAATVTLRIATDFQTTALDTQYEIIPFLLGSMLEAISCRAALKIGVARKLSGTHKQALLLEYRSAIKTAYDNTSGMLARQGMRFDDKTVDEPETFENYLVRLS